MRRLSGIDASFLYLETPNNHMHIGAVYLIDPEGDPTAGSFERISAMITDRLHTLPPFRWRLVEVPFGLHHPLWINDPDFDIENHLRRSALPAPGGPLELAEYAAQFMARPLDRSRPLWELEVVEGLADGKVALISKTHHAAIDGASGAELTAALFDLSPAVGKVDPPTKPWKADRVPSEVETLAYAMRSLSQQPAELARAVKRTSETAMNLRKQGKGEAAGLFAAPRTSFNQPITPHRKFAYGEMTLDDVKMIRSAFGGTVNDVVLAVCSGALRRYLEDRNELPAESLIAMVPMSVRGSSEQSTMGNRISQLLVRLATDEPDAVKRLERIQAETRAAKDQNRAIGADVLSDWAQFAAPAVAARAARLYSTMGLANRHKPIYNVTISNVPGPQFPLYCAGAKLTQWYPMGPIFDGIGLNMTVMSYLGKVYLGLLACRETMAGVWDLAADVHLEVAELLAAAAPVSTRKAPPKQAAAKETSAKKTAAKKTAAKKTAAKQVRAAR
jgi:diacylglycerol O-acyltransferase / wax synthase